ncbi:MAG TPA: HEPN domain-containing protein [Lacipirellulaceae bacterium]|nr:HEPN domain-containing protein [Lacipirellulaceae bacterium]HMP06903.1 HEPN domain-containing protein [Lacipirellulaceae bacterium]
MALIHQILRTLLDGKEFRQALAEAFYDGLPSPVEFDAYDMATHMRRARGVQFDELDDTPFKLRADLFGEPSALDQHSPGPEIREAIEKLVVERLPSPKAITSEEIFEIAVAHLGGMPLLNSARKRECDQAYQRFVEATLLAISAYRGLCTTYMTPSRDIPFGKWNHCVLDQYEAICDGGYASFHELRLWESEAGLRISIVNPYVGIATPENYREDEPEEEQTSEEHFGSITGFATEAAIKRAHDEIVSVIGSILITVKESYTTKRRLSTDVPLSFLIKGHGRQVFSRCVSAFWHRSQPHDGRKASIMDRLRNAIILLSYADQAGAEPVAILLSFAAIESIVCEKDELSVNKQISRHVATLFVQNHPERRKHCERIVNKLYDKRSQIAHGNSLDVTRDDVVRIRRIAAGVVSATVSWLDMQEKVGGDTQWKAFMDEINAATRGGKQVVGVPPDLENLIPDMRDGA